MNADIRRLLSGFSNSEFWLLNSVFLLFSLFTFAFLLAFVYYITKGVINQRTQNFLETPYCHAAPIRRKKAFENENFNKTVLLKF